MPIDAIRGFPGRRPVRAGAVGDVHPLLPADRARRRAWYAASRLGSVLYNPAYDPDLCLVYLSHIFVLPRRTGTVLTYWLRIAPVSSRCSTCTAARDPLCNRISQANYYDMRVDLAAEMEYFSEIRSRCSILFYRTPAASTSSTAAPVCRQPTFAPAHDRRDRQHADPVHAAAAPHGTRRRNQAARSTGRAVMRLLYDDFAFFCAPWFLANRPRRRAVATRGPPRTRDKAHVDLLPLPTGSRDLQRLKARVPARRHQRFYAGDPDPALPGGARSSRRIPRWFEDQLAAIARRLETRVPYVYGSPRQRTSPGRAQTPRNPPMRPRRPPLRRAGQRRTRRGDGAGRRRARSDACSPRGLVLTGDVVTAEPVADPANNGPRRHRVDRVTKRFGDFVAVARADFDIRRAEFFSMLGPSGCGRRPCCA